MPYRTTYKMYYRKRLHSCSLLFAATALFANRGYHATTVRMIVMAARSSTGGFYFYFRNKEDIFATALERFAETIADVLHAAIAGAGTNPLQRLRVPIEHLVLLLADNSDEARILIVESSGLGARLQKIRRDIIDSHSCFFEEVLAPLASPLPALTPALFARSCVGSVYESVHHWLELPPEKRPAPQALASAVADFNLRGIAVRKRKKETKP